MMDATTCPECAAPAEIVDRHVLGGTDGPVEHVKIQCVRRHWFLMSARSLAAHRGSPLSQPLTAVEPPARRRP
jgi:hypothetical protein